MAKCHFYLSVTIFISAFFIKFFYPTIESNHLNENDMRDLTKADGLHLSSWSIERYPRHTNEYSKEVQLIRNLINQSLNRQIQLPPALTPKNTTQADTPAFNQHPPTTPPLTVHPNPNPHSITSSSLRLSRNVSRAVFPTYFVSA